MKLPKIKTKPLQMGEFFPNSKGGLILLDPSLKPKERLDTLTHEALHCFAPFLDESAVEDIASGIAKILWRDGYRKEKKARVKYWPKAKITAKKRNRNTDALVRIMTADSQLW